MEFPFIFALPFCLLLWDKLLCSTYNRSFSLLNSLFLIDELYFKLMIVYIILGPFQDVIVKYLVIMLMASRD